MHVYLSLASHAEAVSNGDKPRSKSRQVGLELLEQLFVWNALLFDCSNLIFPSGVDGLAYAVAETQKQVGGVKDARVLLEADKAVLQVYLAWVVHEVQGGFSRHPQTGSVMDAA